MRTTWGLCKNNEKYKRLAKWYCCYKIYGTSDYHIVALLDDWTDGPRYFEAYFEDNEYNFFRPSGFGIDIPEWAKTLKQVQEFINFYCKGMADVMESFREDIHPLEKSF